MTKDELNRLDLNLTHSDAKAKPGYVRCKTGVLKEDQGFKAIEDLPVYNPLRETETTLKEFTQDVLLFKQDYLKLAQDHVLLQDQYNKAQEAQTLSNAEFVRQIEDLNIAVNELIEVVADLDAEV